MSAASRRVFLNPCDYLIYGKHRAQIRARQGGNIAYMMLDADGHAPSDRVRHALVRALCAHPAMMAKLRFSLLGGWPYWRIPSSVPQAAEHAAEQAYRYTDLRDDTDATARLDQLCQARYAADWNLENGPQVRFEHYDLPEGRTRFCLRWPHCLMDAEGAQWFLTEIGAAAPADATPSTLMADAQSAMPCGGQPELDDDHQTIDVLVGRSLVERLSLARRCASAQQLPSDLDARPLVGDPQPTPVEHRAIHRNFTPLEVRELRAKAKRITPPGPALYARFLAACVIRALHRLHSDIGAASDAYLITLPTRVTLTDARGRVRIRRPVPGNYLVSAILCARRERVDDPHALGADILEHLEAYRRRGMDLSQWALLWWGSLLRASIQPLLFRLPLGFENLSSGFSYYGDIARPVDEIAGATVTNVYGGGPIPTPPGLNPVFSKFRDRLNLSLTWNRPAVPDDLAHRYADLIEREILEPV